MTGARRATIRLDIAAIVLLCAAVATAGPPAGDDCADCIPVGEGFFDGTTIDNTGAGDDSFCAFNDVIDEWYCYTATCTGTARASTCSMALFDTSLAIFASCGGAEITCNDDVPGCTFSTSRVAWPVTAGTTYYVRVSGPFQFQGDYTLLLSCNGCPGPGDCFEEGPEPGCDDQDCCTAVCGQNPGCCDVAWDAACVETAALTCGDPACPAPGSCLTAHGTPGCDDPVCCNLVCLEDPFCCDVVWDGICAGAGLDVCADEACPGPGSCFAAHPSPGCDDTFCCNLVCLDEPFCCDGEWDQACADAAAAACPPAPACGAAGTGDCFAANGTPYCDAASCCEAVCAAEPACCSESWEQACADLALASCSPANDGCDGQAAIGEGLTAFHTFNALTDGAALDGVCNPGPNGDDQIHHDVWYGYVAPCAGDLTVSTCGLAGFDTRLAVYDGTGCPDDPGAVLGCNDDGPDCAGATSEVTLPVAGGQPYLIRVGGAAPGVTGAGVLDVALAPASAATLTLGTVPGPGGVVVGEMIDVTLAMSGLCLDEAAGFQAFIQFDVAELSYVIGDYSNEPFGIPVLFPIQASGAGEIDLVAVINQFEGQEASGEDAVLAVLTFEILSVPPGCAFTLSFRDHDPPTRLTGVGGNEIVPLTLEVPPPSTGPGDANFDGKVNVDDLVAVILSWGFCPAPPEPCPADFDCTGEVDVNDLITVILNWSD